jgi:hypothetical protein
MTCIERSTGKEHYRTDPKITTATYSANDLIKKNKQSFAKKINPKVLTSGLLKAMYNE